MTNGLDLMPQVAARVSEPERVPLPAAVEAWPELGDGTRLGYRSAEACQAAASWWPALEVEKRPVGGVGSMERRLGGWWRLPDGTVVDRRPMVAGGVGGAWEWVGGDRWRHVETGEVEVGVQAGVGGGYRSNAEADDRVKVGPRWQRYGRQWLDPETGELVDQLLDRMLPASADPIIRTLQISPGKIGLRAFCLPNSGAADPLPAAILEAFERGDEQMELEFDDDPEGQGLIREFSPRSRRRLREAVAEIDWAAAVRSVTEATGQPARLVFVMLSYPGDWRRWAPDPEACVEHLELLYKRLARKLGRRLGVPVKVPCVWKREFQRRGAPHFHLVLVVPQVLDGEPLRSWLSREWYDVVGSGDERHLRAGTRVDAVRGFDASDPARIASYLAGYLGPDERLGDKEIQHQVPEGWATASGSVGRWWSVRGVTRVRVEVRISRQQMIQAQRYLRALYRSERRIRALTSGQTVTRRQLRARWLSGAETGGSLIVGDGPSVAVEIARALALADVAPWPKGVPRGLP